MTARLRTTAGSVDLNVESYSTSLTLATNQAILRRGRAQYPFTPNQRPLRLTLICPSEEYRARLQRIARRAQEAALNTNGKVSHSVTLTWPERNMYYQGFIMSVPGGAQRYEDVSTVELELLLVYDAFHTLRANFSEADWERDWDFDGDGTPDGFQPPLGIVESTTPMVRNTIMESFNIFSRR